MGEANNSPDVVNPSAVPEAVGTIGRDLLIVAAAVPIVVKLLGARDLTGLLQWLQSSDGATVLAIIVPIVVTAWRSRRAVLKKANLVTYARAAPNSIVVVTEPTPPPAAG